MNTFDKLSTAKYNGQFRIPKHIRVNYKYLKIK